MSICEKVRDFLSGELQAPTPAPTPNATPALTDLERAMLLEMKPGEVSGVALADEEQRPWQGSRGEARVHLQHAGLVVFVAGRIKVGNRIKRYWEGFSGGADHFPPEWIDEGIADAHDRDFRPNGWRLTANGERLWRELQDALTH